MTLKPCLFQVPWCSSWKCCKQMAIFKNLFIKPNQFFFLFNLIQNSDANRISFGLVSPGLDAFLNSLGNLTGVAGALWAELGLGTGLEFVLDDRKNPSAEFVRSGFFSALLVC